MHNKVGIYYAYWTHDWDVDFVPFLARVRNTASMCWRSTQEHSGR